DRLKQLRLDLAQQRGVPAYVIFTDRSLEDMARRQPHTADEFAEIHGVGEAKLRDLAEIFLSAISAGDGAEVPAFE
ncbi:MAG: HRDC domain-containing protein, partial [Rhodospirillaceae bacterium]|nr:HRDC domain-containing protein [Rhodospirillaceae bacterium]